ncbi:MAG TPA: GTP cyclohydrolase FolE2 [Usitatibacter sp.]|nr:GTP cyclohydrolase FolE2 [Usitatibacter sp.]
MNDTYKCLPGALPDIQAEPDARALAIDWVGVSGVRYPVALTGWGKVATVAATWSMGVRLGASERGTHMSRFIEVLEAAETPLDQSAFKVLAERVRERLGSTDATVEAHFTWFVRKAAPASGVASWFDCEAGWRAHARADGTCDFDLLVAVPVATLCPCSREISERGAHNQRSTVRIEARLARPMAIEELIVTAERAASCELYSLLKRVDEKIVTERAYDNPRFAEDLVREVALGLEREPRIVEYMVDVENLESIHNHSARARIGSPLR